MAEKPRSLTTLAILAVVVIVVGAVGGGLLYLYNHAPPKPGPRTIGLGDNVTVNYIGFFGSGPEQGRVFDTSIQSVAVGNASYPKSLQFSLRSPGGYVPLGVYVGPNAPSGDTIGNVTFGGVVTGFWEGLLGLGVNQTRYITIPPKLGYGPSDPACYVTQPLVYSIPVVVSVPADLFSKAYPNETAIAGTEFADPTFHWTDLVLSVNGSAVVVENLPPLGYQTSPQGWPVTVTNITSPTNLSQAVITITNDLTAANTGLVGGNSTSKVCSATQFIVSAVDEKNGTYTEDFNKEVVGQTLVFQVTPVKIY
jgi:FKBP-type peptidyl-prolyl cis-trans isomerase 2